MVHLEQSESFVRKSSVTSGSEKLGFADGETTGWQYNPAWPGVQPLRPQL